MVEPPDVIAAGGFRVHDRAWVRVTAHAFWRAAAGSVWWAPKVKSRASGGLNGKGKLRWGDSVAVRNGSAWAPRSARGCAARWGGGWSFGRQVFWVPCRICARREADWSGGIKPDRSCWPTVSSGLTPPAQPAWASPADAARNPEHNTTIGKKDPPNHLVDLCYRVGLRESRRRIRLLQNGGGRSEPPDRSPPSAASAIPAPCRLRARRGLQPP